MSTIICYLTEDVGTIGGFVHFHEQYIYIIVNCKLDSSTQIIQIYKQICNIIYNDITDDYIF